MVPMKTPNPHEWKYQRFRKMPATPAITTHPLMIMMAAKSFHPRRRTSSTMPAASTCPSASSKPNHNPSQLKKKGRSSFIMDPMIAPPVATATPAIAVRRRSLGSPRWQALRTCRA